MTDEQVARFVVEMAKGLIVFAGVCGSLGVFVGFWLALKLEEWNDSSAARYVLRCERDLRRAVRTLRATEGARSASATGASTVPLGNTGTTVVENV